jgi:2-C-methyl-D-erythritol 4-phosphate cytidylyltransferase
MGRGDPEGRGEVVGAKTRAVEVQIGGARLPNNQGRHRRKSTIVLLDDVARPESTASRNLARTMAPTRPPIMRVEYAKAEATSDKSARV